MENAQSIADRVLQNVRQVIVGKDDEIRMTLVGLLCEGHLLIEDVPGLGKTMLDHAVRLARLQHCFCIFLEVRPSNPAGIRLYQRNGFEIVGERPDYYRSAGRRENALVMKLDLDEP